MPRKRCKTTGCLVLAVLCWAFGASPLRAEGGTDGSPWAHELWRNGSPAMRAYICRHASRPADWCGNYAAQRTARPLPEPAPDRAEATANAEARAWARVLAHGGPDGLNAAEIAVVRRRAEERGDPQAMEILGYLFATGTGMPRDPGEAYLWYGRAFLAGERQVKANMDMLWPEVVKADPVEAQRIVAEFSQPASAGRAAASAAP